MRLDEVYAIYPTHESCIEQIENVLWLSGPICPYCSSTRICKIKQTHRHHCSECNTSFAVTVNTIFHDSKLPLQKWFCAILLLTDCSQPIPIRTLQQELKVTYKTAWSVKVRIRRTIGDKRNILKRITKGLDIIR